MMDQHRKKNTFLQYPDEKKKFCVLGMSKEKRKRIYSLQHTAGGFVLVIQHIYICIVTQSFGTFFLYFTKKYSFHFIPNNIKYTALLFEIHNVCSRKKFHSSKTAPFGNGRKKSIENP